MSELVEGARLEIVYSGNWVGGSNPPLSAECLSGDVAQLGERLVRNEEVGGSIPLISTNSVFWADGKRMQLLMIVLFRSSP
jgi:hypothetical protein